MPQRVAKKNPVPLKYRTGMESVTNTPATRIIRTILDLTGGNDPGGQVMGVVAGLDAPALMKKLGIDSIKHGTRSTFKKFDPSKYDINDVLGWMTHGAERPGYADEYAFGKVKPKGYGDYRPQVIPIVPKAKNVLDLVDPNPDDIAAALAALPKGSREKQLLLEMFKDVKSGRREAEYFVKPTHWQEGIPDELFGSRRGVPKDNPATRAVADQLRLTPEQFEKTPFDAIRYSDVGEKSWAVPERTPIETPWGAPLTDTPKPIRVIRSDTTGGGVLEKSPTYNLTPESFVTKNKPLTSAYGNELPKDAKYVVYDTKKKTGFEASFTKEKNAAEYVEKLKDNNPFLDYDTVDNYLKETESAMSNAYGGATMAGEATGGTISKAYNDIEQMPKSIQEMYENTIKQLPGSGYDEKSKALWNKYKDNVISADEYNDLLGILSEKHGSESANKLMNKTTGGTLTQAYSPSEGITSAIGIEDVPGNLQEKLKTLDDWLDNDVISASEHGSLEKQLWTKYKK